MMKGYKKKLWLIPIFMISGAVVMGFVIMGLWNWLMPTIFGLGMITFWQALGLLILGRLLLGGFRKHRHFGWGPKHRMAYAHCRVHHNKNIERGPTSVS